MLHCRQGLRPTNLQSILFFSLMFYCQYFKSLFRRTSYPDDLMVKHTIDVRIGLNKQEPDHQTNQSYWMDGSTSKQFQVIKRRRKMDVLFLPLCLLLTGLFVCHFILYILIQSGKWSEWQNQWVNEWMTSNDMDRFNWPDLLSLLKSWQQQQANNTHTHTNCKKQPS